MAARQLDSGYTAGTELEEGKVVALVDGLLYHYYPLNPEHYGKIVGFTLNDYENEDDVTVIRNGYVILDSLEVGEIYYATYDGGVTSTVPELQPIVKVGIAKTSKELIIDFNDTSLVGTVDDNNYFP